MHFNRLYFIWFLIILIIEINIAAFLKSGFIRHTFGDVLVVIMLYCFIKSFLEWSLLKTIFIVLLFAFIIEFMQLTPLLKWLGLEDYKIANIIFGNTFHYIDLIAYSFGALLVIIIENLNLKFKPKN